MVPVPALWALPYPVPPLKPQSFSLAGAPVPCISVVLSPVVNATEGIEGAAEVGGVWYAGQRWNLHTPWVFLNYCNQSVYRRTEGTWGHRFVMLVSLSFHFLNFRPNTAHDRCWVFQWEMAVSVVLGPLCSALLRAMPSIFPENSALLCQTYYHLSHIPL